MAVLVVITDYKPLTNDLDSKADFIFFPWKLVNTSKWQHIFLLNAI